MPLVYDVHDEFLHEQPPPPSPGSARDPPASDSSGRSVSSANSAYDSDTDSFVSCCSFLSCESESDSIDSADSDNESNNGGHTIRQSETDSASMTSDDSDTDSSVTIDRMASDSPTGGNRSASAYHDAYNTCDNTYNNGNTCMHAKSRTCDTCRG